jgi:hypothetical protein
MPSKVGFRRFGALKYWSHNEAFTAAAAASADSSFDIHVLGHLARLMRLPGIPPPSSEEARL